MSEAPHKMFDAGKDNGGDVGQATILTMGKGQSRDEIDPGVLDTKQIYAGNRYLVSQLSVLVGRYVHIRGDFMVSAAVLTRATPDPDVQSYIERVRDYLKAAKTELESDKEPNLPVASQLLSLADRSLVWLYPREVVGLRCSQVAAQLETMRPRPHALIAGLTHELKTPSTGDDDLATRQILSDGLTHIHAAQENELIEDDLQVTRLRRSRWFLLAALVVVLAAVPFTTTVKRADTGPFQTIWPLIYTRTGSQVTDSAFLVLGALGLAALGATGGVISGMFRVRDTRASLKDYRTSMYNFTLKPLIGATAAVCVYLLLSWETINGIKITSGGTYVVAAFLAGFSERYFLRFLNDKSATRPDEDTQPQAKDQA
ncbi:hypothetical protein ACXJJ3_18175 [Kribbella sp. WER1]